MRKIFSFGIILAIAIFSLSLGEVHASLVTVDKAGDVVLNVLSEEDSSGTNDQAGTIEVVGGASEVKYSNAKIALTKDKGKLSLSVLSSTGGKDFDITDYKDSVLEIEERPAVQKLTISVNNGTFLITQGNINAETDYQIQVDPKKGNLALETPSGYKFLTILPKQAASVLLRSKLATTITQDERAYILEDEKGNLYYDLTAKKVIPIFNIYNYEFGVRAKISATTGEIISIDEPTWYRFFNFLFV
jgi:hypothetical protein